MNEAGKTLNINQKFKETFGRPPKESELGELMKLQRKIEGWKEETHKRNQKIEKLAREKGLSVYSRDGQMQAQKKPDFSKRTKTGRNNKLTEPAKMVNRMIKRGMNMREIGSILGKSHQAVSEMKRRYGLPREDVE